MVHASTLIGRCVRNSDAVALGEVEGVEVDTGNWIITHLRVILTKQSVEELHLEKPILWDVVLTLPVTLIKGFDESISLNVPFSEIATLVKPK